MDTAQPGSSPNPPPSLWLLNIAPLKILIGAGGVALLVVFASIQYLLNQPFYDLQLQTEGTDIVMGSSEHDASPSNTLYAIKNNNHSINIDSRQFVPDPDYFSSFEQLRQFIAWQQQLYTISNSNKITLVFADQSKKTLYPTEKKLASIPIEYWLLIFYGSTALFVGVGFWSYQRGHPVTRLLALAGVGFAIMQYSMAIYAARELALPGDAFRYLIHINHFGGFLFVWCLTQFFWFYPKQQQGLAPPTALSVITILIWMNEWYQWIEWPFSLFYFPTLFVVGFGVIIIYKQWQSSKLDQRNRVLFFWIVLSIILCMGLVFVGYLVPLVLFGLPWVSTWVANGLALCVFMGFILGANRNQLFGIETWWFKTWLCFAVFSLLIIADITLVYLFGISVPAGFEMALLAIWWLYYPVKRMIWDRMTGVTSPLTQQSSPVSTPHFPPGLPPSTYENTALLSIDQRWEQLLINIFSPLDVHTNSTPCHQSTMSKNGLKLTVPFPHQVGNSVLTGKNRGNKLFSNDDVRTVTTLLENIKQSEQHRENQQKAVDDERDRIMRDLHDDVASNLLTLSHQAESERSQQLAGDTLKNLREIIYCLDTHSNKPLIDLLFIWREEIEERVDSAHIHLDWSHSEALLNVMLSPRQWLNLGRSLRELVSNAIKHAKPSNITINWTLHDGNITVHITDNGQHYPIEQWQQGKGLCNIQRRASELAGSVSWAIIGHTDDSTGDLCQATFILPIISPLHYKEHP